MFNEWIFPDNWQVLVITLCTVLHQRSAWRLAVIIAGIIFAKGRRTITSWFRAAGISRRYKAFYYFIGSIGSRTETIAAALLEYMMHLIYKGKDKVLMGIDDTPTRRYGPYFAIEQNFHDLKETEGAGQQQVRNFWANIGVFHLNMWVHTMVELWAWNKSARAICDRSGSPWDAISRRPSHADRCAGLRREVIAQTFFAGSGQRRKTQKIVRQLYKLIKLAA